MDKELKPCPFCGGEAELCDGEIVQCSNEDCQVKRYTIQAWNTRVEPKGLDEGEVYKFLRDYPEIRRVFSIKGLESLSKEICQTFKPKVDVKNIANVLMNTVLFMYKPIGIQGQPTPEEVPYFLHHFKINNKHICTLAQAIADHLNKGE